MVSAKRSGVTQRGAPGGTAGAVELSHCVLIRSLMVYSIVMDPDQEEEILLGVAAGLDPLTAIAATDEKPPKPQRSGCLAALLVVAGIAWALAYVARL